VSTLADILSGTRLFGTLQPAEIDRLEAIADVRSIAAGTYLAREDDRGDEVFLILSGRACVEIRVTGRGEGEVLGHFESGDFVGETVLLGLYRRAASVRALDDVEVAAWNGEDLDALFEENHHLGYVVMRNLADCLCHRLQSADLEIERLLIERSIRA
jgi:CRP-like cAMP-binding protein